MQNFDGFKKVKILIVGDVMLDQYWWGSVSRISPEAPVPVVALDKKSVVPGGAANVAANVKGLEAVPYLVGIMGDDKESVELRDSISNIGISTEHLLTVKHRPTTVKTRVIANSQQVVRVDHEDPEPIFDETAESVWQMIAPLLKNVDVVLISDYAKGLITEDLSKRIIKETRRRGKIVLVDPKGKDYQKYKHANVLTPNEKEAFDASGMLNNTDNSVASAGTNLLEALGLDHLVITRGKHGMKLFSANSKIVDLDTKARRVFDVTGAGDTVISTLAVALGAKSEFLDACQAANAAAGIVVEKVGTRPVELRELINKFNHK